jgi:hypothetical protein
MSKYGNERDLEIAAVIDFIKEHKGIRSVLDVGAHNTHSTYAKEIKGLVKQYCGVDIVGDLETALILDNYFVGNVLDEQLKVPSADLVFSISSIEHSGISTYQADWKAERVKVFKKMYELADKYLIVTCPFGAEMLIEGQYANISAEDLDLFRSVTATKLDIDYYFTPAQQSEFTKITYEEACKVEFDPNIGIPRCIAIIRVYK